MSLPERNYQISLSFREKRFYSVVTSVSQLLQLITLWRQLRPIETNREIF